MYVWNLREIILKLFHRLIAAHEYFPTCSVSLKWFWNNFRTPLTAEIILFHLSFRRGYMWNKALKLFLNNVISHVTAALVVWLMANVLEMVYCI